jgi:hypothetical protein
LYDLLLLLLLFADYGIRLAEMLRSNNELARHAQIAEQDNLLMKVRPPCSFSSGSDTLLPGEANVLPAPVRRVPVVCESIDYM